MFNWFEASEAFCPYWLVSGLFWKAVKVGETILPQIGACTLCQISYQNSKWGTSAQAITKKAGRKKAAKKVKIDSLRPTRPLLFYCNHDTYYPPSPTDTSTMAKSARASSRKANNQKLKRNVFGPVETARTDRLSAKLMELVAQAKPVHEEKKEEEAMEEGEFGMY